MLQFLLHPSVQFLLVVENFVQIELLWWKLCRGEEEWGWRFATVSLSYFSSRRLSADRFLYGKKKGEGKWQSGWSCLKQIVFCWNNRGPFYLLNFLGCMSGFLLSGFFSDGFSSNRFLLASRRRHGDDPGRFGSFLRGIGRNETIWFFYVQRIAHCVCEFFWHRKNGRKINKTHRRFGEL